jgi:hypothetical protein
MLAIDMLIRGPLSSSRHSVLLVTDVLHPIDELAVHRLLNGNMRHRGSWRCAMPVFLTGRKPDHISRTNFLNRFASVPTETFFSSTVTCISPGKLGSSNLSLGGFVRADFCIGGISSDSSRVAGLPAGSLH